MIQSAVVLHFLGEGIPISESFGINEVDPAKPIAVHEIPMALDIILLADVIPKEVPEVHPTDLVIRKEPQILSL